jgi:hypothetical protein
MPDLKKISGLLFFFEMGILRKQYGYGEEGRRGRNDPPA